MLNRRSTGFALACSAFLLGGCGRGAGPGEGTAPADVRQVTLHVEDMAARLDLR
jgi:hypothetical protein